MQHRVANSLQIIASVILQNARKVQVGGDPRPISTTPTSG
ncbi:MAG: histidine kinase dimerization/phosphoacceptor domain -containing protein [Caulobacteraceae bacterium]